MPLCPADRSVTKPYVLLWIENIRVSVLFAGSVEEARLISEIFKNYNRRARPVKNVTGVVQLRFDLALKQILDVVCIPIIAAVA